MSERNTRPKPPARRTGGRALGGAKKTAPPPPPPAAELTPEQFAAEQAAAHGEGRPAAHGPQATARVEGSAQGRTEATFDEVALSGESTVEVRPGGVVPEPIAGRPVRPAFLASEVATESAREGVERPVQHEPPAAEPAVQPTQPTGPDTPPGLSLTPSAAAYVAPAAEVAVHSAATALVGGTAFPVRSIGPTTHQEQYVRSEAAPSEGAPWAPGAGRPKDIPETAVILNQRIITREGLDSSVPAALKLKKRIKRFALDNELDHLPIGDIVAVALDEWLTTRGF